MARFALLALFAASVAAGPPPAIWSSWPRGTPSNTWADGPFLGDGNQGVVIGGADGIVTLYIAVHGLWSVALGGNSTMPPLEAGEGFPNCPGQHCNITVGLTLATVSISSPSLIGGSWNATLSLADASALVELSSADGASKLRLSLIVSATPSRLMILDVESVGAAALALNVTTAGNGNTQHVPVNAGCTDGTTAAHVPCAGGAGGKLPGHFITKDANPPHANSPLPLSGALASRPLQSVGATLTGSVPFSALMPHSDWATGKTVDTVTTGTTTQLMLAAGGSVTYVLSAAATRDEGVSNGDPSAAVEARLASALASDLPTLRASHAAWWASFWARSSVTLDARESDTEAFWWTAMYALGSGTRPGAAVMDLWSPWRTTDYSAWRSNPTMVRRYIVLLPTKTECARAVLPALPAQVDGVGARLRRVLTHTHMLGPSPTHAGL